MRILGIIPARGGSKGVPRKNIRLLGGKPLLFYTAQRALEAKYLDSVIVSTDDEEIAEVASKLGLRVPFLRPAALAADTTPTLPAIRHALEQLAATAENYDAICLLQPTSPFRKKGFIDAAIETFQQQQTDSLISVLPVPHEYNPHWVFVPDSHNKLVIATGEKSIITRRQELPPAFIRDGSLYLAKTAVIMQQNSLYGNTIGYVVNDKEFYVNIDTPADWELAEQWIANRAHTYET